MITDNFGRNVVKTMKTSTKASDYGEKYDVYDVEGMTFKFPQGTDEGVVLSSINAHAPEGWQPPAPDQSDIMAQIQSLMEQLNK